MLFLCCTTSGAVLVSNGSFGTGYGNVFSYDCHGNESSLLNCDSTEHGNYNHDNDYGVVCGCCIDACNPDPAREVCPQTTITTEEREFQSTTTSDLELSTNEPDKLFTTRMLYTDQTEKDETTNGETISTQALAVGNCGSNDTLFALVGILVFVLVAVIMGWIVSVVVLKRKIQLLYEHKRNLRYV